MPPVNSNGAQQVAEDVVIDSAPGHGGLEAVLIANRARLLSFFISRTRNAAEAEEVVQEIFLRLGRMAGVPIADPLSYLYRIGLNIVVDRTRTERRRTRRDEAWSESTTSRIGATAIDETPSPFAVLEARQQAQRIAAAIETLPTGAGRAFRLHKLDGLSHSQVAAALGISRSGVEKHMAVAFRHLAAAFEP